MSHPRKSRTKSKKLKSFLRRFLILLIVGILAVSSCQTLRSGVEAGDEGDEVDKVEIIS